MSAKPSELSLNILKNKFQKSKCKRLTVTNGMMSFIFIYYHGYFYFLKGIASVVMSPI